MPKLRHGEIMDEDAIFAHISNDHAIAGSGLEGNHSYAFANYILKVMKSNDVVNQIVRDANLVNKLKGISNTDPQAVLEDLEEHGSAAFQSGWPGTTSGPGHSIIGEMEYAEDGDLIVRLHNRGDGSQFHANYGGTSAKYVTEKIYRVPKAKLTE